MLLSFRFLVGISCLAFSAALVAQEAPSGTYKAVYGGYAKTSRGTPWTQHLVLQVQTTADGKATGKINVAKFGCSGDHDVVGTYADGKLKLSGDTGKQDCPKVTLQLEPKGPNLVGKFGSSEVEFTK